MENAEYELSIFYITLINTHNFTYKCNCFYLEISINVHFCNYILTPIFYRSFTRLVLLMLAQGIVSMVPQQSFSEMTNITPFYSFLNMGFVFNITLSLRNTIIISYIQMGAQRYFPFVFIFTTQMALSTNFHNSLKEPLISRQNIFLEQYQYPGFYILMSSLPCFGVVQGWKVLL